MCVVSVASVYAQHANASNFQFTRSLQVGMSGSDVRELQKVLNSDSKTQISASGIGSPGQESMYFGQLTKQAVIRFQEMYRNDILTPNGLSSGTGYVGPSTIKVLNRSNKTALLQPTSTPGSSYVAPSLAQQGLVKDLPNETTFVPQTTPSQPGSASTIDYTNPNLAHVDEMFAATNAIAAKQGLPPLSTDLKNQVLKDLSTTTNMREKFVELARKNMAKANTKPTGVAGIMQDSLTKLVTFFSPNTAVAQTGTDFGTPLISSTVYCTCSGDVWLIYMSPLPPTFPVLLSYTMGTQMYMTYSALGATQLLGKYQIGTQMCYMTVGYSCIPYPNEGWITPFLGSS